MTKKILILSILLIFTNSRAQDLRSPEDFKINKIENSEKQNEISYLSHPILFTFKTYQIILGPVKGENCRMYPSCSNYGIEAIKKYNLKGLLMTIDRLNRCGHDLKFYKTIFINNQIKYLDEVTAGNK